MGRGEGEEAGLGVGGVEGDGEAVAGFGGEEGLGAVGPFDEGEVVVEELF